MLYILVYFLPELGALYLKNVGGFVFMDNL